jgi:hypothetical protein
VRLSQPGKLISPYTPEMAAAATVSPKHGSPRSARRDPLGTVPSVALSATCCLLCVLVVLCRVYFLSLCWTVVYQIAISGRNASFRALIVASTLLFRFFTVLNTTPTGPVALLLSGTSLSVPYGTNLAPLAQKLSQSSASYDPLPGRPKTNILTR